MPRNARSELALAFGRRVRELRIAAGMSQEAFALRAGLNRTYLGDVERGERNVALENIGRIARALGIPLALLFENLP